MQTKVKAIVAHIHKIANPGLALEWDNVGLQIGNTEQEVRKILLTLDVTENAVNKAIEENVDLIISHHPLILKPIKKITNPLHLKLIKNNISVFCIHTNLDVVNNGVNFALSKKLGLLNLEFLSSETGSKLYLISVRIPRDYMKIVSNSVTKEGAAGIHTYGRKLEFFADSFNLQNIIKAIKKAYPSEKLIYAVYPQERTSENYGLGLIGNLKNKLTLKNFAEYVKDKLQASFVKLWLADKDVDSFVRKIAICGGSGSSLLPLVYGRADVFVSSGFNYHTLLDSKIPLIDAGHFYTENPVLENLKKMLTVFDVEIMELKADEHEIRKQIII